jgi:hypothetical protein
MATENLDNAIERSHAAVSAIFGGNPESGGVRGPIDLERARSKPDEEWF